MVEEQYYSIDEISKILKVAYLTVYRWVRSKRLVALKAGKQYRIKKEDLTVFMKEKQ
ncbi:helix-turn-helix domain-containing protein [Candidatus Microgenomates bacterium]|nr:helix-turn-helix domain-containing protein [Candidatus Microgenomates bacterium]